MKRRETIKTLVAGSIGSGLLIAGCADNQGTEPAVEVGDEKIPGAYGRTPEEAAADKKLHDEVFFTPDEMAALSVLCDIIIPPDDISGSATDARVPDFIEFMMKDYPPFQLPVRGGLMWLNHECLEAYGQPFAACSGDQQLAMVDRIADAESATPEDLPGVRFFNIVRNLTATGFFTSEMGIRDLGYQGNVANFWDGVPDEVLLAHGLSYEEARIPQYIRQEDANRIPEWDENGRLIG